MSEVRAFRRGDAEQVAGLFHRQQVGPHTAREHPMDAAGLLAVLDERGVRRMQVAESGGAVVGTLGFFRTSGQRVAAPDEAFAGMFVIDARHRGGLMAGRLFAESILPLLDDGVDVLRTEVRPTNRRAAPLYERVGFVALDGPAADEDGYTELVSFLPRVLRGLRERYPHLDWNSLAMGASWRSLINRSDPGATRVETVGGRTAVRYRFAVGDASVSAAVDGPTGTLTELDVTVAGTTTRNRTAPPAPEPAAPVRRHADGPWSLALDEGTGLVTVHHDAHPGALLLDPWPVLGPPFLTGWRRQARRRLAVRETDGGWHVTEGDDRASLHRETVLRDGVLHQRVRWQGPTPPVDSLLALPWHQLRQAQLVTADGVLPSVRGLCPEDLTDYEALSADRPHPLWGERAEQGMAWWDPAGGLALRPEWDAGVEARFGGAALPALRQRLVQRREFGYRVRLSRAWSPAELLPGVAPAALPDLRACAPAPAPAAPRPPAEVTFGQRTVARRTVATAATADGELLLSAADGGVVLWRDAGERVLSSPFPRRRPLGSLTDWRAGLWVDRQGPREDPETGLGWGESTGPTWQQAEDFGLAAPDLHWSMSPSGDGSWTLRVDGAPVPADGEAVVHLTPAAPSSPQLLLSGADGTVWHTAPPPAGRLWTSSLAVRLADGRWLTCRPAGGAHQEVLCRVLDDGVLVSLVGRLGTAARWTLAVTADEREATAVITHQTAREAAGTCAS
ncbi:GNAT family N-acetyltransferase [Streptomyces sp. AV19]|uniref:GNAT family N-acetyltransferase n=1 Tax=Streptomyces sp. AV19 TaxID=2793068 RepID=UPI0018FEB4F6|nr:GNAT family N-acetyltransferase [Streptomyces sp. AV19]MBH1937201.1 GNAT family N-acetyltransferase [Streptomyces sp. AV19]MDG4533474.1 GNAT family N-acetyltransferase [Streptomyces sp. AV19]